MSRYFIQAADVLFFKDGREVAPGSEYSAASVFPPNPGTIYGALRSCLLSLNKQADFDKKNFGIANTQIGKIVGTQHKKWTLKLSNFRLGRQTENKYNALFRLPLDVLQRKKPDYEKGEQDEILCSNLKDRSAIGLKSNAPGSFLKTSWFVHQEGSFFEHEPAFITENLFYNYLIDDLKTNSDAHSLRDHLLKQIKKPNSDNQEPFLSEPRMGIVINDESHTVEEAKLFTTPFIRPSKDIGFLIDLNIDSEHLPDNTKLRLGGDGKIAVLNRIEKHQLRSDNDMRLKKKLTAAETLKLVLTTPAVFKKGWLPDGIDPDSGKGEMNGVSVTLRGVVLGKYENLGGWDVSENRPKMTRRAVPAGSIYYFSTPDPQRAFERLHKQSICAKEDAKQGLGITYIGVKNNYV